MLAFRNVRVSTVVLLRIAVTRSNDLKECAGSVPREVKLLALLAPSIILHPVKSTDVLPAL